MSSEFVNIIKFKKRIKEEIIDHINNNQLNKIVCRFLC